MHVAVQRQPRWRLAIVAVLLALGLTAAVAAAPEDSPLAPPSASALHNWDVKTGASCGLEGGSGSLVTEAFIDYSSSLGSIRVDRLKMTNTTSRTLTVKTQFHANWTILNDFTVNLSPGQVSNFTFRHDTWYSRFGGADYEPFIVVKAWNGSDDVLHNHFLHDYPPSTRCLTPAP